MENVAIVKRGIKSKIPLIIVLNVLDGILTYLGITYGYASEINPITKLFIADINMVFMVKMLLPTLLFALIYTIIDDKKMYFPNFMNKIFTTALIVYVFITLNHVFVLTQYFNYLNSN